MIIVSFLRENHMSNPDLFTDKIRNNPNRPLGIVVFSIFYLFGACVLFISMFMNYAGVAEQITLAHGLPLDLKFIALPAVAILAVVMSYGLYSLSRWGYYLTSIYQICFGAVSLFLSVSFGKQPFLGNFIWSLVVVIYLVMKRQIFTHPGIEEKNLSHTAE
jgi:uncharacterized membrane protein (DUF2068 family)